MDFFPVIGIGASAGGVDAMRSLFGQIPRDIDAAFLVVLHVPTHSPSHLDQVLGSVAALPVSAAKDGERIRPGHIYVAVPDRHLIVQDGHVRLSRGPKECRVRPAVDVLFRSMAVCFGPRAAGVVLSGTLDDGTAGLWSLKEHGGQIFVQDPNDAQHRGMPESAITHVPVDVTASASELASELTEWSQRIMAKRPAPQPPIETHKLEVKIASEANALQTGIMGLGAQSQYTCPDCHGVLVRIEEGRVVRYRCHTGHAFSGKTLLEEVNTAIDNGLWATLRAIEERLLLLRELGQIERSRGAVAEAEKHEEQAGALEKPIEVLRRLVLDPSIFGH